MKEVEKYKCISFTQKQESNSLVHRIATYLQNTHFEKDGFDFCTRRTSSKGDYEMGSVCVCMGVGCVCVVNIVNPAVDWPPLHTLTNRDKSWPLGVPTHVM